MIRNGTVLSQESEGRRTVRTSSNASRVMVAIAPPAVHDAMGCRNSGDRFASARRGSECDEFLLAY